MQYKIYALALPFDLRCESGTYVIVISRYEYDIVVLHDYEAKPSMSVISYEYTWYNWLVPC